MVALDIGTEVISNALAAAGIVAGACAAFVAGALAATTAVGATVGSASLRLQPAIASAPRMLNKSAEYKAREVIRTSLSIWFQKSIIVGRISVKDKRRDFCRAI
jgi:hypothetical protein